MSTRKTVATMDEAEREYKRRHDRLNQQYSRARKRRRFEELQTQNKKLTAELEAAKAELENYKRRETAVRSALDWVSAIVAGNDSSSAPSVKNTATSTSRESQAASPKTCPPETPIAPQTSVPESNYDPQALNLNKVYPYTIPDVSSTFNSLNGDYVLNLPLEFGDGAWVNLLSNDLWQPGTLTDCYNAPMAPLTPGESPTALSQTTSSLCLPDDGNGQDADFVQNDNVGTSQMQVQALTPIWQELPLTVGATNELDKVILEVTAVGRQWKSKQGDYHSELSHPSFPSISSLLNRDFENDRSTNPLAAALAKYTVTTPVVNFPRKVAFHYTVAHLLRWLVNPTEQSFRQLPEFLHPTLVQKTVPHPAWIDTVPWPKARDRIIMNLHIFDYELFKRVTRLSSINWPHSDREIFIAKQGSKQMMLNPKFVRHILNVNNWTNSPDVAKAFPFLSGWPTSPPSGPYQWAD